MSKVCRFMKGCRANLARQECTGVQSSPRFLTLPTVTRHQPARLSKAKRPLLSGLLLMGLLLTGLPAQAAITDCVVGVDSSAVFGRANFGNVDPLAPPGGPVQASFTYFAECNRTSPSDPRRVQFQITLNAPSTVAGMSIDYAYSTIASGDTGVITLDWGKQDTGLQRGEGVAVFTLRGLTPQTTPGAFTFTQLTSTRLRTCDNTNTSNCTGYGAARLEDALVSVNVIKSCTVAPSVLNFGAVQPSSVKHSDAAATTSVVCTRGTPYLVKFSGGNPAPAGQRRMRLPGQPAELNYQVYADPARTSVLQNASGLSGSGEGVAQQYGVYGRVFSNQFPAPGAYTDTLTMTVEY